ncbi:histidyl-tRNA synthetase, putative [Eimeria acervulina]|uniref:histidine--tRNA ligase n=1 Tax=Eimeria acervulina TaxID=5801 RepID=U6GTZ4_EIMAC|nr:histidyl-tRNA synthetase, putative [Eimeria acervulina]CDI83640.1 histidyl-tRNA synthetase, putative [Eimeria acervulina]
MQVLDRASRRSREETEMALAEGLGITVEMSRRVIQRLLSFDINNVSMVRELGRKLQRLGKIDGMHQKSDSRLDHMGTQTHSGSGALLSSGLPTSVKDLQCVLHLLREVYQMGEWVDIDLLIVRGLHYYTGVVFEAFDAEGAFRAILGGGCYGEAGATSAVADSSAVGPWPSTEIPTVSQMHLNPNLPSSGGMMRTAVTGVGLGMGDCVLMNLLQRKGLLPSPGPAVDAIVAVRQASVARHVPGQVSFVSPRCAPSGNPRLPEAGDWRNECCYSTPSATSTSDRHSIEAQQLCCKLRALGLRVELLLPPQRSERAAIKHARSVGVKAVIFVGATKQKLPMLTGNAEVPGSAVSASFPPEGEEMTNAVEFKVFLNSESCGNLGLLDKKHITTQTEDTAPLRNQRVGSSLKHSKTHTTISSVVEMMKAHLCASP